MTGRPPQARASDTAEAIARAALTPDERRAMLITRRDTVVVVSTAEPADDAC